eukprot:scaffold28791_cov33-Phaeocystis_antarctica.AAC.1
MRLAQCSFEQKSSMVDSTLAGLPLRARASTLRTSLSSTYKVKGSEMGDFGGDQLGAVAGRPVGRLIPGSA